MGFLGVSFKTQHKINKSKRRKISALRVKTFIIALIFAVASLIPNTTHASTIQHQHTENYPITEFEYTNIQEGNEGEVIGKALGVLVIIVIIIGIINWLAGSSTETEGSTS